LGGENTKNFERHKETSIQTKKRGTNNKKGEKIDLYFEKGKQRGVFRRGGGDKKKKNFWGGKGTNTPVREKWRDQQKRFQGQKKRLVGEKNVEK